MIPLRDEDKRIINLLSQDLPLDSLPFSKIARRAGISTQNLIEKLKEYKRLGLIRRFGAVLNHTRFSSSSTNAMVVWRVPEQEIEKMGKIASQFPQVSHCYQRKTCSGWPYNFYTMIHGHSLAKCKHAAKEISRQSGIINYKILTTLKEYKKSVPRYFSHYKLEEE